MGGDDGAVIFRKLLRQGIPVLQGDGDEPHPGVAADILQPAGGILPDDTEDGGIAIQQFQHPCPEAGELLLQPAAFIQHDEGAGGGGLQAGEPQLLEAGQDGALRVTVRLRPECHDGVLRGAAAGGVGAAHVEEVLGQGAVRAEVGTKAAGGDAQQVDGFIHDGGFADADGAGEEKVHGKSPLCRG